MTSRLAPIVLLFVLLAGCGGSTPQAKAADPFVATGAGATCANGNVGASLLVGEAVKLTRAVTVTNFEAASNRGIGLGSPQVSLVHGKAPESGTWHGPAPAEPAHTLLNWTGRATLVGAQLAPGNYEIWWTAKANATNARYVAITLGWKDASGATGGHGIAESLSFKPRC
jgi:hypothetical protein